MTQDRSAYYRVNDESQNQTNNGVNPNLMVEDQLEYPDPQNDRTRIPRNKKRGTRSMYDRTPPRDETGRSLNMSEGSHMNNDVQIP